MSLAPRSAISTTRLDWLWLSTTRGVKSQVLAAKAEECGPRRGSSRLAKYAADSLVRFVGRNVPWIVQCTICALSHKLFSRGADASLGRTREAVLQVCFYFASLRGGH